jgi:hypothetical protein
MRFQKALTPLFGIWTLGLACVPLFGALFTSNPEKLDGLDYATNVQPILFRNCIKCHSPGQIAPFSLLTYEDARKWAPMIAQATASRKMPPWKAVQGYGDIDHEGALSDQDRETLQQWDALGEPRGDASLERAPTLSTSEWPFGAPDLVLEQKKPYNVSAEGVDEYRYFVYKPNLKITRQVKAVAVSPGAKKTVHHVILFVDDMGIAEMLEQTAGDGKPGYPGFGNPKFIPSASLGGWVPGFGALKAPEGTVFELKPSSTIVAQIHYHKSGIAEKDQTKIGIYFTSEPKAKVIRSAWFQNEGIYIPAGAKKHLVTTEFPVEQDLTLYALLPHMHLIGKSMTVQLKRKDGSLTPILKVADWDFRWQLLYRLKHPLKIPKDSHLVVVAEYDNSAENPNNPNSPPKVVKYGETSKQEMCLLFALVTED